MSARSAIRLLALDLPPGEAFEAALDTAWQKGDAVLPLDPHAPQAAKRATLEAMRPHAVIDATGITAYDDPAPLDDGVALVIPTSGSTGVPKGAQLSHDALNASADATAARVGQDATDVWLSCLPWQHVGGLQVLLRARRAKLPITVLPGFGVDAIQREISNGATLTSLVPTTLQRLLAAAIDLTPLKAILLGGAPAAPSLLAAAAAAPAPVITTYGMSETCGGCVYDGRPLAGVEVRIADDGRVEISGPTLMTGYRLRDNRETFTADSWLRTGDLGEIDATGQLTILGRADDVIVSGGEKVVGAALAARLIGYPDVVDAAVVGVPDHEWGQAVTVVIEAEQNSAPTLQQLRDWLADQVPAWSLPRRLIVVETIPRLASGKPDRLAIQRLAASSTD